MSEINQLIAGKDLHIHVVVPGTEQALKDMKKELGISLDIENDKDLSLHKAFDLTVAEGGKLHALRGFAIVKEGKPVETLEMVEIGDLSVQIVQEALNK